ncbi:MAG: hypothetical protein AB7K36_03955 [Chloroflexota bacterium]
MRSFLIAWLVAFGLITLAASAITWYVARNSPPTVANVGRPDTLSEPDQPTPVPFLPSDALEVVRLRLPAGAAGDEARAKLQSASSVTRHSPQHWRVCFEDACWVAHGPGRYAEPENDAAERYESRTMQGR